MKKVLSILVVAVLVLSIVPVGFGQTIGYVCDDDFCGRGVKSYEGDVKGFRNCVSSYAPYDEGPCSKVWEECEKEEEQKSKEYKKCLDANPNSPDPFELFDFCHKQAYGEDWEGCSPVLDKCAEAVLIPNCFEKAEENCDELQRQIDEKEREILDKTNHLWEDFDRLTNQLNEEKNTDIKRLHNWQTELEEAIDYEKSRLGKGQDDNKINENLRVLEDEFNHVSKVLNELGGIEEFNRLLDQRDRKYDEIHNLAEPLFEELRQLRQKLIQKKADTSSQNSCKPTEGEIQVPTSGTNVDEFTVEVIRETRKIGNLIIRTSPFTTAILDLNILSPSTFTATFDRAKIEVSKGNLVAKTDKEAKPAPKVYPISKTVEELNINLNKAKSIEDAFNVINKVDGLKSNDIIVKINNFEEISFSDLQNYFEAINGRLRSAKGKIEAAFKSGKAENEIRDIINFENSYFIQISGQNNDHVEIRNTFSQQTRFFDEMINYYDSLRDPSTRTLGEARGSSFTQGAR